MADEASSDTHMQAIDPSIFTKRLRVGIIGAAIAGPTLAVQILSHPILRARYLPVLYDRAPDPSESSSESPQHLQSAGAGIALFGNGLHPLFQLGLEQALRQAGCESHHASFWRVGYAGDFKHLGTMKHSGWAEDLQTHLLAFQRGDLQAVLIKRFQELGGQIHWNRSLRSLHTLSNGAAQAVFEDGSTDELDLVVGADGVYSKVRSHILQSRNAATAEARWLPECFGISGIYGISSHPVDTSQPQQTLEVAQAQTHGLWLNLGNLSSSPLPNGKIRWDLLIPEAQASRAPESQEPSRTPQDHALQAEWEDAILPGAYPRGYTADILRKHASVYHPSAGSMGALLATSERIVHTPLRQRVWNENEIQCGRFVLRGDASRTLLPTSGQGTGFAIEDATVLAAMLLKHDPSGSSTTKVLDGALQEYARIRVPRSRRMAQVAWFGGRLSIGDTWYWRWVRDLLSSLTSLGGEKQTNGWPFDDRFDVE